MSRLMTEYKQNFLHLNKIVKRDNLKHLKISSALKMLIFQSFIVTGASPLTVTNLTFIAKTISFDVLLCRGRASRKDTPAGYIPTHFAVIYQFEEICSKCVFFWGGRKKL